MFFVAQVLLMDSDEVQDQLRSLGDDSADADAEQDLDSHHKEGHAHQHHHHPHALHSQPPSARAAAVIALAEKYFDRVDAAQLLELLPEDTAVAALLRYFQIVLEYGSAQRRNLQVSVRCFVLCTLCPVLTTLVLVLMHCADHSPAAARERGADSDEYLTFYACVITTILCRSIELCSLSFLLPTQVKQFSGWNGAVEKREEK
jgi:hypothetical protein